MLKKKNRGKVICIHNQETDTEDELFEKGSGELYEFLNQFGDPDDLHLKMRNQLAKRNETQPTKERTAGSTFQNPSGFSSTGKIDDVHDLKAWKLIDEAGMRGATYGGAKISEKHSNFLINTGNATADELESLGEQVRKSVFQKSKVKLQWEVIRIGETNL